MPPRIARSHAPVSAPKASKASKINKGKKRQLDAFAIASHEAPEKLQIRQHRLGESFGEHPRAKRRRLGDDDEESEGGVIAHGRFQTPARCGRQPVQPPRRHLVSAKKLVISRGHDT